MCGAGRYLFICQSADVRISESDLQTIKLSFYLPTSDWPSPTCLGPSPLKVQRLVPSLITSMENGLTIVLIEKHPQIFSAFFAKFCHRAPWFSFQVLEEKLIPVTIFWIFSSFFSMLDLTAQILSCWSLISCSSSASSTLRGSTALSVALWHIKQNGEGMINCLHAIRLKNMSRKLATVISKYINTGVTESGCEVLESLHVKERLHPCTEKMNHYINRC